MYVDVHGVFADLSGSLRVSTASPRPPRAQATRRFWTSSDHCVNHPSDGKLSSHNGLCMFVNAWLTSFMLSLKISIDISIDYIRQETMCTLVSILINCLSLWGFMFELQGKAMYSSLLARIQWRSISYPAVVDTKMTAPSQMRVLTLHENEKNSKIFRLEKSRFLDLKTTACCYFL